MEPAKLKLPRASSLAYKELRKRPESEAAPAADIHAAPIEAPPPPGGDVRAGALTAIRLLQQSYNLRDTTTYSDVVAAFSALISLIEQGQDAEFVSSLRAFRLATGEAVYATFHSGAKDTAQAISDLLDGVNTCVEALELYLQPPEPPAPVEVAPPVPEQANGGDEEVPLPPPVLPDESFFLPPAALTEILTISVDPSLLRRPSSAPRDWGLVEEPAPTRGRGRGRGRRGRPRGRGRGGVAAGGLGLKRPAMPSVWTPELQRYLAGALLVALTPPSAPIPDGVDVTSMPANVAEFMNELQESGASEGLRQMGATLPGVRATLQAGGYVEPEEFVGAMHAEAHDAAETYLTLQNPDTRRGKVIGAADSFCNLLSSMLDVLLAEFGAAAKAARLAKADEEGMAEAAYAAEVAAMAPIVNLPKSIQANREPYRHGDWRKTPFVPRPYVQLQEYYIVEEASREAITRKLSTTKGGGCDGQHCGTRDELGTYSLEADGFQTRCECLSRNTECDHTCGCEGGGQCLNRSVTRRETVVLGQDAEEINSWGMDCYTRRNIQDAVLESQAFGEYKMPDYTITAGAAPQRAAATAAGQHAAVAADTPDAQGLADASAVAAAASAATVVITTGAPGMTPPNVPNITVSNKVSRTPEEQARHKAAVERAVVEWIERALIPAINRQGDNGWDLRAALREVKARAVSSGDLASARAADAVDARVEAVGYNYFRVHPKGVGLVCKRQGGLPRLTFVEEYLGEIHQPWRWFELQDAVKKITGDELPDFYNIVLERPKDDPAGYDVLFVDAAAKGAFASRMSHSCTPNCQAVVMACGGRLTIALYTLRHVHEGEELTFDYSSVTESEKEFREAICLCGTHMCRGSYLYFTGSRAFMQVMSQRHNMLHRQVILARAGSEPLTDEDRQRLKRHGLGESCLGSVERGDRVPEWLEKWAALICEYLDVEEACLREQLLARDALNLYTEATAAAEAKGVVANRLQNIVITLDKVRMFLAQQEQPQEPCLRRLTDEEVLDHLWNGPKSVARRLLRGAAQVLAPLETVRSIAMAQTTLELHKAVADARAKMPESLQKLADAALVDATSAADARQRLMQFSTLLREADMAVGGGLTAAADICALYASTQKWITNEKGYAGVTSPPVPINLQDLFLNREATQLLPAPGAGSANATMDQAAMQAHAEKAAAAMARHHAKNPALRKLYRPLYCWGQLNGWFKQTVNDPTASLSAERRGTISLPDLDSCFGSTKGRGYGPKERAELLEHIERRPDAMWKTGTQWSFKNEAKVYGSPMLDAAWAELTGKPEEDPMPALLEELKNAPVPFKQVLVQPRSRSRGRGRPKKADTFAYIEMSDDEDFF